MRSPELHHLLQCNPSPASRQATLIRKLAEEANLIGELIERLKCIEPLLREDCIEGTDAHLRCISSGRYCDAHNLIANYGVPRK